MLTLKSTTLVFLVLLISIAPRPVQARTQALAPPPAPICVPLLSQLANDIKSGAPLTGTFIKAVRTLVAKNAFTIEDLKIIAAAQNPANPFDLVSPQLTAQQEQAVSKIFRDIISENSTRQTLDWSKVKDAIEEMISELGGKITDQAQAANETRFILAPQFLNSYTVEHAVGVTSFTLFGHDVFLEVDQGDRQLGESGKYYFDTQTQKVLVRGTDLATLQGKTGTYLASYDRRSGYSIYKIDVQHNLTPVKMGLKLNNDPRSWNPPNPPVRFLSENELGHLCIVERLNRGGQYVDMPKLKDIVEYDVVTGKKRKLGLTKGLRNEVLMGENGHVINRKITITGNLQTYDASADKVLSSVRPTFGQMKAFLGSLDYINVKRKLGEWDPNEMMVTSRSWFYPSTGATFDLPARVFLENSIVLVQHAGKYNLLNVPKNIATNVVLYEENSGEIKFHYFEDGLGTVIESHLLKLKDGKDVFLFVSKRSEETEPVLLWVDPASGDPHEISFERLGASGFELLSVSVNKSGAVELLFIEDGTGTPWGSFTKQVKRVQLYGAR